MRTAVLLTLVAIAVGGCDQATGQPNPLPGRPGSHRLPVSRASSDRVQRQPRPDSCHARGRGRFSLPDQLCTPGAIDPSVTERDIAGTICRSRYHAELVRPPEAITEPEERASLRAYGDRGPLHDYQYGHLVPLELGGAVNDSRNLWPEPHAVLNLKDALEYRLRERVCEHRMSLHAAQLTIAHNWIAAYRRYVG